MISRERWLSLLLGEKPDRIPTDYWATPEVTDRLLRELRCSDLEQLYQALHIDAVVQVEPPHKTNHYPNDRLADIWGLRRKRVSYGTGAYEEFDNHPLAAVTTVEEVHQYRWPRADDCDYEAYRNLLEAAPRHRAVRTGNFEPFLLYAALRGLEQAMMDFLAAPEILQASMDHIFDYHYEVAQRAFEIGKGRIDVTYIAEDLGGQNSLLFSLPHIRRFILPNQKKMADLARSHGIHIFYHSDGDVRSVIPDLIGVTGIEVLNPIQWRCPSMERNALVRDFGDKIIFHGAMDNQQTLPFGTAADVRAEVLENIGIFSSARWICAPCHNIQPITPTANILAMYETVHEYGELF